MGAHWAGCVVAFGQCGTDHSADAGRLATGIRVGMSFLCFLARHAANRPEQPAGRRHELAGFPSVARSELRRFYIVNPALIREGFGRHLTAFGSEHPTAEMGLGQATELGAMLFLSIVAGRLRMRWFLVCRMSLAVFRFALFALGASWGPSACFGLASPCMGRSTPSLPWPSRIYQGQRICRRHDAWASAGAAQFIGFNVTGIIGAFFCEQLCKTPLVARQAGPLSGGF